MSRVPAGLNHRMSEVQSRQSSMPIFDVRLPLDPTWVHPGPMQFPRFWSFAQTGHLKVWGWSDESVEHAQRRAVERQERVTKAFSGESAELPGHYGYGERPLREEVLREFTDPAGVRMAVISRNSMGCRVLNTAEMMFVDVDEQADPGGGFWSALFGRKKAPEPTLAERIEAQAREWVAANPMWRWRIYQTRAGVRLMAVHGAVKPEERVVPAVFETFGADPLYRQLCHDQECFRARLTPKPFRCEVGNPPVTWPFRDTEAETAMRDWEKAYLEQASNFATCRFVAEAGSAAMRSEFAELVQIHDDATQAHENLPLA